VLIIVAKDLITNEDYVVYIQPYISQKVVEILKERMRRLSSRQK
jgi:hypothetical protein